MTRSLFISLFVHFIMFLMMICLSVIRPPLEKPPTVKVTFVDKKKLTKPEITPTPTPEPENTPKPTPTPNITPPPTPKPTPPQTPAPTPPPRTPVPTQTPEIVKSTPTPIPTKTSDPKQTIKKPAYQKDVIKDPDPVVTPKPYTTATPTPTPTPKVTVTPTPTATPYVPTPTPTPYIPMPEVPDITPTPDPKKEVSMEAENDKSIPPLYLSSCEQKIRPNFKPPKNIRSGLQCKIQFYVMLDGKIVNVQVIKSTGSNILDQYAIDALKKTGKVPEQYGRFKKDRLKLTITFHYDRDR